MRISVSPSWPWASWVWGMWVGRGNPSMTSRAQGLSPPTGYCPLSGTLAPSLVLLEISGSLGQAGVSLTWGLLGRLTRLYLSPLSSPNSHPEPSGAVRREGQRDPQNQASDDQSPWEAPTPISTTVLGQGQGSQGSSGSSAHV